MRVSVGDLVQFTKGSLISGFPQTGIMRVSTDTRTIRDGDLFVALAGPRFDGHSFLRVAADRGAGVLLIHCLEGLPAFDPERTPAIVLVEDTLVGLQDLARGIRLRSKAEVVGLTGSNGKTTTKEMLAKILSQVAPTLATRGNLNNHIGLPLTLCELQNEHRFAVIEMGTSKIGDMKVLVDVSRPTAGLITNVGKDHLEFLENPGGVLKENRGLYDALPKDGAAVINLDDPLLAPLARELPCRKVTYGQAPGATVRATDLHLWPMPTRFKLHLGEKSFEAELNAPGAIQVVNAVAAAATAWALGIPAELIVGGLKAFKPAAMRLQVHERGDGSILVNDAYNANPSSMRASIESFCQTYPSHPHWLVLGDMRELGTLARSEHRELGEWLAKQAIDKVFLYGRDTRFVRDGMTAAGAGSKVERFSKKRYLLEALEKALTAEHPAVLFKASRSLQLEQVLNPLLGQSLAAAH